MPEDKKIDLKKSELSPFNNYNVVEAHIKGLPEINKRINYLAPSLSGSLSAISAYGLYIVGASTSLVIIVPILLFGALMFSFKPIISRNNLYNHYLYHPRPAECVPVTKKEFFKNVKLATLTRFMFFSSKVFDYTFFEVGGKAYLTLAKNYFSLRIKSHAMSLNEWEDAITALDLEKGEINE